MARDGHKPRTLESRRAAGEPVSELPVLVGGRPTLDELARAPVGLDKYARAAWHEVVPQLVEAKLIDRVDRHALEAYALHMGRARALREAIEWEHHTTCECPPDGPHVTRGPGRCRLGERVRRRTLEEQFTARTARGFTSNPLLSQEREALREARMMGELLGLNPVGRTRLGMKKPKGANLGALTGALPRPALVAVPGGKPEPDEP